MYQLQLCPFCGGEANYMWGSTPETKNACVGIMCSECGANIPTVRNPNPELMCYAASNVWNKLSTKLKTFLYPDPFAFGYVLDSTENIGKSTRQVLKEWKIPEENWHFYGYTPKPRKPKVAK